MSATDTEIRPNKHESALIACRAAVAVGYSTAFTMYAAIFAVALITLGLVLIRQANMINFNDLVATLEQRDLARRGLPDVLNSLRDQRKLYSTVLSDAADCLPVVGRIRSDGLIVADGTAATDRPAGSPALASPVTCEELQNTIKDHENDLRLTEDKVLFKMANNDAWYMDYVAGMTQKMPQIIPALRFVDSDSPWINAWARSSYELMEMFLLVSMGMLGGIIGVTRWVVIQTARAVPSARPVLSEYFYRPALGGIMALGAFVVFKAGQLIIGAQAQDGGAAVAASVFLLAALGLVSGLCADKALERIEKGAGLFRADEQAGQRPPRGAQLRVIEPARAAGDNAGGRPGRIARPKTTGPADEPPPENLAREGA